MKLLTIVLFAVLAFTSLSFVTADKKYLFKRSGTNEMKFDQVSNTGSGHNLRQKRQYGYFQGGGGYVSPRDADALGAQIATQNAINNYGANRNMALQPYLYRGY